MLIALSHIYSERKQKVVKSIQLMRARARTWLTFWVEKIM